MRTEKPKAPKTAGYWHAFGKKASITVFPAKIFPAACYIKWINAIGIDTLKV